MHYLINPITKNTLNKLCNMMIPRNEQNRRQTPNILIHVSRTGDPTDRRPNWHERVTITVCWNQGVYTIPLHLFPKVDADTNTYMTFYWYSNIIASLDFFLVSSTMPISSQPSGHDIMFLHRLGRKHQLRGGGAGENFAKGYKQVLFCMACYTFFTIYFIYICIYMYIHTWYAYFLHDTLYIFYVCTEGI